jgi:sugar phosphate isomerase/epimerase
MKLGIAGGKPLSSHVAPTFFSERDEWRSIDAKACGRVRAAGFRGAQIYIRRPLEAQMEDVARVRRAFEDSDLEVAQLNGAYETLCNPDDARRAHGIAGVKAMCRIAGVLGAKTIYVRPGGLNAKGPWYPHPENHSAATFNRIVDSLRQVAPTAQTEAVTLAVEGHVLSALDTPARVLELIDAVGSPALKFNVDPVNFIGAVRDVYDTPHVLNELFDYLGTHTVVAHAKDCKLADLGVVHIDEVRPGAGTLDYALFMQRFQHVAPDGYLVLEHMHDEQVFEARDFIVTLARQLSLPLEQ